MSTLVLVADEDPLFQELLCAVLSARKGISCISVQPACDGPALLAFARKYRPDAIVAGLGLRRMNGADVLRELRQRGCDVPFFLTCTVPEDTALRMTKGAFPEAVLRKPFDVDLLGDHLEWQGVSDPVDREFSYTSSLLLGIGIPIRVLGFQYLREAIRRVSDAPELAASVTGRLYPAIAEQFDTSCSRVERNIRHAIRLGWPLGDVCLQRAAFGRAAADGRLCPTNTEFITAMAEMLRARAGGRFRVG